MNLSKLLYDLVKDAPVLEGIVFIVVFISFMWFMFGPWSIFLYQITGIKLLALTGSCLEMICIIVALICWGIAHFLSEVIRFVYNGVTSVLKFGYDSITKFLSDILKGAYYVSQ